MCRYSVAGDSFAGAFVCAASRQWPLDQAVALGQVSSKVCVVKYVQYSVEDDLFVGCISCVVKYSKSSS